MFYSVQSDHDHPPPGLCMCSTACTPCWPLSASSSCVTSSKPSSLPPTWRTSRPSLPVRTSGQRIETLDTPPPTPCSQFLLSFWWSATALSTSSSTWCSPPSSGWRSAWCGLTWSGASPSLRTRPWTDQQRWSSQLAHRSINGHKKYITFEYILKVWKRTREKFCNSQPNASNIKLYIKRSFSQKAFMMFQIKPCLVNVIQNMFVREVSI